jgi:hypothetical protein
MKLLLIEDDHQPMETYFGRGHSVWAKVTPELLSRFEADEKHH